MTLEHETDGADGFDLVRSGASYRVAQRLGLSTATVRSRWRTVVLFFVVTWVPLLLLSLAAGHAAGDRVLIPFLHDPEVHARLLIVLPLLELSRMIVRVGQAAQVRHLREIGIVPDRERARYDAACSDAMALRGSTWSEAAILAVSYGMAVALRLGLGFSEGSSSWERIGSSITPAGWWLTLVSLPILYFFLLRWFWIFLVWSWFLFRVSRMELQLTPTHPDRTGGLGFLGWGLASFATVLMAVSTVCSASFADEILHHGESLDSLKYHVASFVVTALIVLHLPLLCFAGRLSKCRFTGLLEFGALAWRHDRAFDEKWLLGSQDSARAEILGSNDVQSLADIATCYEHVDRMWPIPFDGKAFAILVLAALVPMLPLVGTAIPLQEIFMKLGEMLI